MKPEKLYQAIGEIDDGLLAEADAARHTAPKRRFREFARRWGSLAAAVVIAAGGILYGWKHRTVVTYATYVAEPYLAGPVYPRLEEFTVEDYLAWREETDEVIADVGGDSGFAARTAGALFSKSDGANLFYSPYNAELSLVSLADMTAGATRAELLEVAGESDLTDFENRMLETNRTINRGDAVTVLRTEGDLRYHFYLPDNVVSQGAEKIDPMYNRLNRGEPFPFGFIRFVSGVGGGIGASGGKSTFGFGNESIVREYGPEDRIELDRYLFIRSAWLDPADTAKIRRSTFHGLSGACETRYVVAPKAYTVIGEGFTAVRIPLLVGGDLWLALPDDGTTPESLIASGALLSAAENRDAGEQKTAAVPCFSVASEINLKDLFTDLGASKVFTPGEANLSPFFGTESTSDADENALISEQKRLDSMQIRAEDIISRTEDYFKAVAEAGASRPEDEEGIRKVLESLSDILKYEKERLENQLREVREGQEDDEAEKKYAVTHMLQPIRLMVNETGVKTGAYKIYYRSPREEPKKGTPDASLIVDRPFAVLITAEDGTILLAGAVNDLIEE